MTEVGRGASGPPEHVLDLFAVPAPVLALSGGQGGSVLAGDLVLSPGRDARVAQWLSPVLARLAVRIDERPRRSPLDLRVAVPVPARDGSWVVDGWAASRYERGTTACRDLDVVVAAAHVLHAELAVAVPQRPEVMDGRDDRWARAEALAFDGADATVLAVVAGKPDEPLVRRLLAVRVDVPLGPSQLVHGDLAGNILLDAGGAPVVIDVAPYWRPVLWAEAVCVLDAMLWAGAAPSVLGAWRSGAAGQAMLRAALFRVLSDRPCDVARYEALLQPLLVQPATVNCGRRPTSRARAE